MQRLKTIYLSAPVLLILICTIASTVSVLAVTFWTGNQITTVDFGNGGVATYKDIALPTAFFETPTSHTEQYALNVTTQTNDQKMVFTQTSTQRTNLNSNFDTFTVTVSLHSSGVVFTWNLLTDLTAEIPISTLGTYEYDYAYDYTTSQSSGSFALDWDLALMSV